MHRRWFPVAVTGLLIAASAAANAAESRDVREREARKACFTGDVDRGVEILVDLYGETGHPNYIFNQARCFERNGKYDQALLSYEDYLRKATNLGEADRAQVEKSIAELRAKVASSAPPPAGGAAAGPALLAPTLDVAGPTPPPSATEPPPPSSLPPGGVDKAGGSGWPWQRTAGVVSLIVAGGSLAFGVAGHVLRESRSGDFNDSCTINAGEPVPIDSSSGANCRGKHDSVQSASRMMWIGYIGAGALTGAGVALLLLAPRADRPGAMALARRCGPMFQSAGGTSGVVCGWSF
jgi:hypothetical protein